MGLPVVAIFGRPNVGKSTLFNRLSRRKSAVVDAMPGVTRDRNYSVIYWAGREFVVVDTGGVITAPKMDMELAIVRQAEIAAREADLVLFVIEKDLSPEDEEIARRLHHEGLPVMLAVNKIDRDIDAPMAEDGWRLGLGKPFPISAQNGRGVGDMLDAAIELLPKSGKGDDSHGEIRIAVVGKPNVGKSSFVNRLLGEEKLIVDANPGTTRDPIDTPFTFNGRKWVLTDTAGLLKKKQFGISYYSSLRTVSAVKRSDVVFLMTDAVEGFNQQDKRIAAMAVDFIKGLVIGVNKWDRVESEIPVEREREIYADASFLKFAPIVTLSALTGRRVRKALEMLERVADERKRRIDTAELNVLIERLTNKNPPPIVEGKRSNILYATQEGADPPIFVFFCRGARFVPENYKRYLLNGLRKEYGFEGVSLKMVFRENRG